MSTENLDHVVAGALYDFMGWLTTRQERLILSSMDDAAPAARAVNEFIIQSGLDKDCDPMIKTWKHRCNMQPSVTKKHKKRTKSSLYFSQKTDRFRIKQSLIGNKFKFVWLKIDTPYNQAIKQVYNVWAFDMVANGYGDEIIENNIESKVHVLVDMLDIKRIKFLKDLHPDLKSLDKLTFSQQRELRLLIPLLLITYLYKVRIYV